VLDDAHAFWLRAPGRGKIRPVALPEPGRGDVVVRTLRSGVSRGTETLVFRGGVPPSQHAAMRAPFQEGTTPASPGASAAVWPVNSTSPPLASADTRAAK
jgi:hypothetical protein